MLFCMRLMIVSACLFSQTTCISILGYEFDIKVLKSDTKYTVENTRGHKFDINVCSPVKGSPCVGNSGKYFFLIIAKRIKVDVLVMN